VPVQIGLEIFELVGRRVSWRLSGPRIFLFMWA